MMLDVDDVPHVRVRTDLHKMIDATSQSELSDLTRSVYDGTAVSHRHLCQGCRTLLQYF